jgi:zinc finger SWIM domain-containing protein 3
MGKAIEKVFTESYYGLCTFHIMQNAVKHLSPVKGEDEVEGEDDEPHILSDFSAGTFYWEVGWNF